MLIICNIGLPNRAVNAENTTSNKIVIGVCIAAVVGLSAWGIVSMEKARLARREASAARLARLEQVEKEKRDLEFKTDGILDSISKEDLKSLKQKVFDESKTFVEYVQKLSVELKLPEAAISELKVHAEEIVKSGRKDPETYKPLNSYIASKLFLYSVRLTSNRAQLNENIRGMSSATGAGIFLSIGKFFEDDPSVREEMDYARADLKQTRTEKGISVVSGHVRRQAILTKAKAVIATERAIQKIVPRK